MSRQAFDERRDQRIAADYHDGHMPCTFCSAMTAREDLATYGARCLSCFRAYCDQGRHYPSLSRADRAAMGKKVRELLGGGVRPTARAYMADMARRVDSGEANTPGQRGFIAAARRPQSDSEPLAEARPAAAQASVPVQSVAVEPVDDPPAWAVEDAGLSS